MAVDSIIPPLGPCTETVAHRACLKVQKVYDGRRTRICEIRQFDATPPVPVGVGPYLVVSCEIVPNSDHVISTSIVPLPGTIPPLAEVTATIACDAEFRVIDTFGVEYTFIREVAFTVTVILYTPDPFMDVQAEIQCFCLDACLEPFETDTDVVVSCYFGAFIQIKVHAEAELCIKEYGECQWPEITTQSPNPCIEFLDPEVTPFPPFNLPQLQFPTDV